MKKGMAQPGTKYFLSHNAQGSKHAHGILTTTLWGKLYDNMGI